MSKLLYKSEVIIPHNGKIYKFIKTLEEITFPTQTENTPNEIETIDLTEDESTCSNQTTEANSQQTVITGTNLSPRYTPPDSPRSHQSTPKINPQDSPPYYPTSPGYSRPYSPYNYPLSPFWQSEAPENVDSST